MPMLAKRRGGGGGDKGVVECSKKSGFPSLYYNFSGVHAVAPGAQGFLCISTLFFTLKTAGVYKTYIAMKFTPRFFYPFIVGERRTRK